MRTYKSLIIDGKEIFWRIYGNRHGRFFEVGTGIIREHTAVRINMNRLNVMGHNLIFDGGMEEAVRRTYKKHLQAA